MFDGTSLRGWDVVPSEAAASWSVQNGAIVGDGDLGRSYLVWHNHKIVDFELRASYRFPGRGNSGISIRARPDTSGRRLFQSDHADLGHVGIGRQILGGWDFHTPGRVEHRCYRGDRLLIDRNDQPEITAIEDGLTSGDIRPGGWNDVVIRADGNRFTFVVNGKLASEFTELLPPKQRLRSGMIQLQLHDPGMKVEFRNLWLKVLESTEGDSVGQIRVALCIEWFRQRAAD